jgi:tight adherence protein C
MSNELMLPLVGLFLSVAFAAGAMATYVVRRFSPVDRRLRDLTEVKSGESRSLGDLDLAQASYGSLEKYASMIPKSRKEMSTLRKRVAAAGIDRPEAAALYAFAEIGLPIVAATATFLMIGPPRGILLALLAAAVGYLIPGLWLGQRRAARKKQIQNGLPDALDLLLISMEAGSGLDQALVKVSNELELAYPALAGEFRHIITEIRAGRPRAEALRQFADRSKVEDVRALVMTMIQTDRFGTSIAQALRTHADTARVKRRQRAEERAAKLGVKLVFPLVFCLFPAMFVVVLGPAVLRMLRVLGPMVR